MGVSSSLYTGVSGLSAQGDALGVIGDNIANANTVGFKASRAEFQDMIAGRGVKIGSVNPVLAQGSVDATEKITDLAIAGEGYFALKSQDGESFTRDGSFRFDREGFLVTKDGGKVQGFQADNKGQIINKLGDIRFPRALIPARATEKINMDLNLDSRTQNLKVFDAKNPYDTSHYSTGIEVYDSQGNKHLVNMFFTKTADRVWNYYGLCDGKEITGARDEESSLVLSGQITFTTDGKLDTEAITQSQFNFRGGALQGQVIKVDFGDSVTTDQGSGLNGAKQFGKESDLISWNQDGGAAGTISSLAFNDAGILTALYSNGQTMDVSQVALAKFE